MSTHVSVFRSFFRFLHHFVLAKLVTTSIRVKWCQLSGAIYGLGPIDDPSFPEADKSYLHMILNMGVNNLKGCLYGQAVQCKQTIILASRVSERHVDTQTLINYPSGHPKVFQSYFVRCLFQT